jgi:tight adherence protein B
MKGLRRVTGLKLWQYLILVLLIGLITWLISDTFLLAACLSVVAVAIPTELSRFRRSREIAAERDGWPMVIDHLISGVNSGVSLQQSVADLSDRGPVQFRARFQEISFKIHSGQSFVEVMKSARTQFYTAAADQVIGVIALARVTGSSDVGAILRTLGEFLRQENALRSEIEARHGWVRSSASLAAIAPWLLLLILASQPSTRSAFSTETGLYILGLGLVLTAIAYMWMNLAGRLPEVPRALA